MPPRKRAASPEPSEETPDVEATAEAAPAGDEVKAELVRRGGWDVGYVGEATDKEPNESYTVAGQLGATAQAPAEAPAEPGE